MPIFNDKVECSYGAEFGDLVRIVAGSSSSPKTIIGGEALMGVWASALAADNNRITYNRLYLAAASASGEAGRFYTTVNAAGAVGAHGAHISVSFGTSGTLTGQAAAVRATAHVPNKSLGGTFAALYAELYADGASSAIGGNASFLRCVFAGESTGAAAVEDNASLIRIEGGTINTGNMIAAKSSAAVTHVARITVYGTPYYIMLSNAI